MRDSLTLGQIEIVVGLDTTTMCVRGHGIPYSTRIELCQTKLQLAGTLLQHVVHDELIDRTVVGLFHGSHWSPYSSLQRTLTAIERDPLGLVMLVSGSGVQVELSRILRILRAKLHFLVHIVVLADMPATDVERLLR